VRGVSAATLFRRVTRYPVAASVDPRENLLTEVTAAVLERVHGLAHVFAREVLAPGPARAVLEELTVERVDVRTQVATRQGRFVDLELLLRPRVGSSQQGLLIWVEVKHGADLSGDQLDAYVADIEALPVEGVARVVVLLGPRGWSSSGGSIPPGVVQAEWQGVARAVASASAEPRPAEEDWLLGQYIDYLKEEGLSEPNALTAVSALALMESNRAYEAAAGVCEYADEYVQNHWGQRGSHKQTTAKRPAPSFGPGYYANYSPHRDGGEPDPNWRGAWFEWGLRNSSSAQGLEATRGAWVFMAGATLATKNDPTKAEGNEEWFATRVANGFQSVWLDYYRLAVVRYPDELLSVTTIEVQGKALGRWIVHDAFGDLASEPPPA
jgi:hypothetical protein